METKKPKRYFRKIVKNGSSLALNLPKEWIEENQVQLGDLYEIIEEDHRLIIQKVIKDEDLDPVFLKAMENSYKRFEEDLKELRDR
ncbi:AbrB/MazE/SpoVT family DNA-binding domain-containing protein [Hazenella coriacea]|uniref:Antidote-toxin recognition antitoxin MazE n=1 Tax=Hazenella coriacea TaxID=1179467 RepID=A0A4R3L5Q6_9BACL|nr:AbrB/MazE/SpoVT family DNA-binding domain-containing protein [Hazenella coriacea]TCS94979.1 antidote-toxin recognition antitoxin MazE [Hazenella coriacea]